MREKNSSADSSQMDNIPLGGHGSKDGFKLILKYFEYYAKVKLYW
jgi:hypothetical protein